jgi:hypothetical protein
MDVSHGDCRPRRWTGVVWVAALAALLLLAPLSPAAQAHASLAATPSGHVTVIVLDMSGSMQSNDALGLRCSAANAYIDLSGPGDFVGVVGLKASGATGGPRNFPTAVDWGLTPREMATVNARAGLRAAIAQRSNNCAPAGTTPTYDALARAATMLTNATQNGALSGSVILLTDGAPDPDASDQISAIQHDLVPQFKQHGWPVDTVALGPDSGGFHAFLGGLASATSGTAYDDGHGVVPGVSPLNIMPFFLDIFRLRNGRSPGPDIAPTALAGGTTARNFSVGAYVSHLDIVVVKDSPQSSVSLLAPNGQRLPPPAAGAFISTDPYYAIFAIDNPQQGAWELDVAGNGQFLMSSLKVSTLALALTQPGASAVEALGEPFTIAAQLTDRGSPISGGRFSLSGTLAFAGDTTTPYAQQIALSDATGSGAYTATVTVPASAPSGSYTVTIRAHAASEDVLTVSRVVRVDLFPAALFLAPETGRPTADAVRANVTGWDRLLQILYGTPLTGWLAGWPLGAAPAIPSAVVHGQVTLKGQAYPDAQVTGTALRAGSKTAIPVTVANDGGGAFHVSFPSDASGAYAVVLTTQGTYAVSHGDLTHVTRTVNVTIAPATPQQELRAWLITLVYLLILAYLVLQLRYVLAPKPFGRLVSSDGSGGEEFARARRGLAGFFAPSAVTSSQMELEPGLIFGFHRRGRITVQGTRERGNYRLDGNRVPLQAVPATEAAISLPQDKVTYTVVASGADDEEAEEQPSARREIWNRLRGRRGDDDDDAYADDEPPRRGLAALFAGRRGNTDDDDAYDAPRGRARRAGRYEDDDAANDAPARSRWGRSRRRDDDDDDEW